MIAPARVDGRLSRGRSADEGSRGSRSPSEREARDAIRGRMTDSQYPVTGMDDGIAVTGPDGIEVRFRVET